MVRPKKGCSDLPYRVPTISSRIGKRKCSSKSSAECIESSDGQLIPPPDDMSLIDVAVVYDHHVIDIREGDISLQSPVAMPMSRSDCNLVSAPITYHPFSSSACMPPYPQGMAALFSTHSPDAVVCGTPSQDSPQFPAAGVHGARPKRVALRRRAVNRTINVAPVISHTCSSSLFATPTLQANTSPQPNARPPTAGVCDASPRSNPHPLNSGVRGARPQRSLVARRAVPLNSGVRGARPPRSSVARRAVRRIINNVPTTAHILPTVPSCTFCNAKRFKREPPGFCCATGRVTISLHDAPDDLWELFTGTSPQSKEFQTFVRTYNNTFAFTSFGVTYDKSLCHRNNGIYTFKAQGQVYHYLNALLPSDAPPSYLQLYFFDTEHEVSNRLRISDKMNPDIITRLLRILRSNPYCQFFRSLSELPNLDACQIVIRNTTSLDQRVYNAPASSQVAAIWLENIDGNSTGGRDILVHSKAGSSARVKFYYGCYDPMQYVLLLPFGEPGWHQGILKADGFRNVGIGSHTTPNITSIGNVPDFLEAEDRVLTDGAVAQDVVSCREYYAYLLQIRPRSRSVLLHGGRLLQQYAVDMYIKLESSRLSYFSLNQKRIRSELYCGIVDSIAIGERRGFKIGSRVILPATFIGGPRDMRRRYLDAMTLVQKFGKPDFFITMTCNPNWTEIKRELLPGEEAQNRPDLAARVFRAKFEELKNDIVRRKIFGPIAGYVYVIEFQKRGLPHVHMLVILQRAYKIRTPEQFDQYVSAEIPNPTENPHLHRAVCKHMMHGPCGALNPENVCMGGGRTCKKHFPKEFCERTSQTEDSYPLYRRRDNKRTVTVRKEVLDNRWVIPYNAYLLGKFDCHINVEICSTVKAVKYLYKYIYKGHDRVSFNVVAKTPAGDVNEITTFRDGRWVGPAEAMWRIYRFVLNEIYPAVFTLQLHLENQQSVSYADDADLHSVLNQTLCRNTTLTEYFEVNKVNAFARTLLYEEFPEHFVWRRSIKKWKPRKKGIAIGRVVSVSPMEGERYYLKLLLGFIRGATSYDELKIVGGVVCETFMEAATLHGLCEADDCFRISLEESCRYLMPNSLRRLFSTILVYCNPVNGRQLWEEFAGPLSEDFATPGGINQKRAMQKALLDIGHQLESMGKNINDYYLVDQTIVIDETERGYKEINDERSIKVPLCDIQNVEKLNYEQRIAFDAILERTLSGGHGAFFIDGPGGTGKSFLYTVLLGHVRSKGHIALATASSGVAASILPGGRTAHSRFKIPINIDDYMCCSVKKQSGVANLMRTTKLIIWDEAPMVRRQAIEAFERMLRDVCESNLPFGGKVVVFGGDFRQVLPVVPKGSIYQTVQSSLVKSPLWSGLQKYRLVNNVRASLDPSFSEFLLEIGEDRVPHVFDDEIRIPPFMLLPYTGPESLDALIEKTFPDLNNYSTSLHDVINRAILSTRNDFVEEINDTIIDRFPGEYHEYRSFDRAIEQHQQGLQESFFNSITPSGFPPHVLKLKKDSPVILLRNIDPANGLCNGTRLIVKSFGKNTIGAIIASGNHEGKHVFLPRIPLTPATSEIGVFPFRRMQFPIRLCFCMTINKAQGQTLDFVGLYLPQSVFSHGQLYVAMSRARVSTAVSVLIVPSCDTTLPSTTTRNVVYGEVLKLAAED